MILKLAQNGKNGGWSTFEFTERINKRKKDAKKQSDIESYTSNLLLSEDLSGRNVWDKK